MEDCIWRRTFWHAAIGVGSETSAYGEGNMTALKIDTGKLAEVGIFTFKADIGVAADVQIDADRAADAGQVLGA